MGIEHEINHLQGFRGLGWLKIEVSSTLKPNSKLFEA